LPKPRIPFSSSFCRENRRREGADGRMRGHVSPSSILVRPQRAGYCRNIEIERGQIVGLWESWVNCYTGRWVYIDYYRDYLPWMLFLPCTAGL
jgi:hypothetical protein